MSKLSILTVAATVTATANFDIDSYLKNDLIKNPKMKYISSKVVKKEKLNGYGDWVAYLVYINLKYGNKDLKVPETFLVNEKLNLVVTGTRAIFDYKKHKFIGSNIRPKMDTSKYYDDSHLIAGNKDAKHKLVVFSDPMCPFCRQHVPKIYKDVKAHPNDLALYYYHLPLQIHPASAVITRVMEVLQKQGRVDDAFKLYTFPENMVNITDEDRILSEIKKRYKIDISKADIDKKEIKDAVNKDVDMSNSLFVKGTPTVYLDGKFDKKVTSYKQYIK